MRIIASNPIHRLAVASITVDGVLVSGGVVDADTDTRRATLVHVGALPADVAALATGMRDNFNTDQPGGLTTEIAGDIVITLRDGWTVNEAGEIVHA